MHDLPTFICKEAELREGRGGGGTEKMGERGGGGSTVVHMVRLWLYAIITITTSLKAAIQNFLQTPHCYANCLHHVRSSSQRAIMCKSCANTLGLYHVRTQWACIMCKHIGPVSCANTLGLYHVQYVVCYSVKTDSSTLHS